MADRNIELDDMLVRPGTYLNPQTEVLVVVDDSSSIDGEIFNLEEFEGADWVIISDEVPVEDSRRDELLEEFQSVYAGGDHRARGSEAVDGDDDDDDEDDEPPPPTPLEEGEGV